MYVEFGSHVYQQTVGIPMGTNCAPLVADLFLYSYETNFVQHLQRSKYNYPSSPPSPTPHHPKSAVAKSDLLDNTKSCNVFHSAARESSIDSSVISYIFYIILHI